MKLRKIYVLALFVYTMGGVVSRESGNFIQGIDQYLGNRCIDNAKALVHSAGIYDSDFYVDLQYNKENNDIRFNGTKVRLEDSIVSNLAALLVDASEAKSAEPVVVEHKGQTYVIEVKKATSFGSEYYYLTSKTLAKTPVSAELRDRIEKTQSKYMHSQVDPLLRSMRFKSDYEGILDQKMVASMQGLGAGSALGGISGAATGASLGLTLTGLTPLATAGAGIWAGFHLGGMAGGVVGVIASPFTYKAGAYLAPLVAGFAIPTLTLAGGAVGGIVGGAIGGISGLFSSTQKDSQINEKNVLRVYSGTMRYNDITLSDEERKGLFGLMKNAVSRNPGSTKTYPISRGNEVYKFYFNGRGFDVIQGT